MVSKAKRESVEEAFEALEELGWDITEYDVEPRVKSHKIGSSTEIPFEHVRVNLQMERMG